MPAAAQGVTHLEVEGGLAAAAAQDGSVHVWDPGQVLPHLERATACAPDERGSFLAFLCMFRTCSLQHSHKVLTLKALRACGVLGRLGGMLCPAVHVQCMYINQRYMRTDWSIQTCKPARWQPSFYMSGCARAGGITTLIATCTW